MIVFENLKWKNFLSTGNNWTEIHLNRSPSTLIVGQNGSGKCLRGNTVVKVNIEDPVVKRDLEKYLEEKKIWN